MIRKDCNTIFTLAETSADTNLQRSKSTTSWEIHLNILPRHTLKWTVQMALANLTGTKTFGQEQRHGKEMRDGRVEMRVLESRDDL